MSRYLDIATTPSVAVAQQHYGSADQWARVAARGSADETAQSQHLGPAEAAFIRERDGFILPASLKAAGHTSNIAEARPAFCSRLGPRYWALRIFVETDNTSLREMSASTTASLCFSWIMLTAAD